MDAIELQRDRQHLSLDLDFMTKDGEGSDRT